MAPARSLDGGSARSDACPLLPRAERRSPQAVRDPPSALLASSPRAGGSVVADVASSVLGHRSFAMTSSCAAFTPTRSSSGGRCASAARCADALRRSLKRIPAALSTVRKPSARRSCTERAPRRQLCANTTIGRSRLPRSFAWRARTSSGKLIATPGCLSAKLTGAVDVDEDGTFREPRPRGVDTDDIMMEQGSADRKEGHRRNHSKRACHRSYLATHRLQLAVLVGT